LKRCKHATVDGTFSTDEEFDIEDGIAKTLKGIWIGNAICILAGTPEEQYKKRKGFFFCNEERCGDCIHYEPDTNGREIRIKSRNPISQKFRHEIFKRDKYRCIECGNGKKQSTLHIDHIIPISKGGTDELDNLQTLCETCNLGKNIRNWKGGEVNGKK